MRQMTVLDVFVGAFYIQLPYVLAYDSKNRYDPPYFEPLAQQKIGAHAPVGEILWISVRGALKLGLCTSTNSSTSTAA